MSAVCNDILMALTPRIVQAATRQSCAKALDFAIPRRAPLTIPWRAVERWATRKSVRTLAHNSCFVAYCLPKIDRH